MLTRFTLTCLPPRLGHCRPSADSSQHPSLHPEPEGDRQPAQTHSAVQNDRTIERSSSCSPAGAAWMEISTLHAKPETLWAWRTFETFFFFFYVQKKAMKPLQFTFSCTKSLLGVEITADLYAAACGQQKRARLPPPVIIGTLSCTCTFTFSHNCCRNTLF